MKIVSWNVNGIRACHSKGDMDRFLTEHGPDILCLQETKALLEQVSPDVQTLGFPFSEWFSAKRKGYSGVATFSKRRPESFTKGLDIAEYDQEGRVLITEFDDFALYNIYFPNGGSGEERHQFKQKFLIDLTLHLKNRMMQGRELMVLGDYNIAPTELDVYDPVGLAKESGFLPEEREWYAQFIDLGFVDLFRCFHPDRKNVFSWWSYRELARVANRGWRIDHICCTKNLQPRVRSAQVLTEVTGSDHCPVMIEMED